MKSQKTFYDTLQVPRNASIAALRTAHKTLSAQLQPEQHPQNPGAAAQQMLLVNKALEVLIHPDARQAYDAWLSGGKGDTGVPTLPELVEPPSQASGSTRVGSEALAPLPTLDLDSFEAEVAAKARARASASTSAAASPPAPAHLPNPAPKPVAPPTAAPLTAPPPAPAPQEPNSPSGFPETQPYHPLDAQALSDLGAPERKAAAHAKAALASTTPGAKPNAAARQSPALAALDWLRERPIALVAAVLACVLLVAFAPWLWHASVGAFKPEVPAAAPLQPTYVEPALEAVSAPAAAAEPAEPTEPLEPVDAVQEPAAQPPTANKSAHKAKPRKVTKRVAEPRRAQEAAAPVQQPEPVVAPVPVDTGGHSGFAPKCRWVTPTNWSCK